MLCLFIVGYAICLVDGPFASIVGGQCEVRATLVFLQQTSEEPHTGINVLAWVEGVSNPKFFGSIGHQLHHTHGTFRRDRTWVKAGFLANNLTHQFQRDSFAGGALAHECLGDGIVENLAILRTIVV